MREPERIDIDRATELAWGRFQERLAEHLAGMVERDVLFVGTEGYGEPADGATPYLQFCLYTGDLIRAEACSNAFLAAEHRLTPADEQVLLALGWNAPTGETASNAGSGSPFFFIDSEQSSAPIVAILATRALRDVYAVPHPAFLVAPKLGLGLNIPVEPSAAEVGEESEEDAEVEFDEWKALRPGSRDELCEMVAASLRPGFGGVIKRDDDGDIPVRNGSVVVFVRVLEEPVIQLFSFVVQDVADAARARLEVEILNRDSRFVRYHLSGSSVIAVAELPAQPYVPRHLLWMLDHAITTLDAVDDDLSLRVGGRRFFDPSAESTPLHSEAPEAPGSDNDGHSDELPPELLTLLELDAEGRGDLDLSLVARVCHDDPQLILSFIRTAEEETISWQQSWEEATLLRDDEEAAACLGELRGWEATAAQLRGALRTVLTRGPEEP